jgi:hypothetical protein
MTRGSPNRARTRRSAKSSTSPSCSASLSAGLFLLIATVWAGRLAQNTVAAIFGVFSAFWLSFGFLLIGATSGWWGYTADNRAEGERADTGSAAAAGGRTTTVRSRVQAR